MYYDFGGGEADEITDGVIRAEVEDMRGDSQRK